MPRASGHTGYRYLVPIDSTGAPLTEAGRGIYALTNGQTYHYIIGGIDAPFLSVNLIGLTSAAIVTSATIRATNAGDAEISNFDATAGYWPPMPSASMDVATEGAGWSVASGVGAVAGGAVGGLLWQIRETGAARTRLTIVMGGTGGNFIVAAHGKW